MQQVSRPEPVRTEKRMPRTRSGNLVGGNLAGRRLPQKLRLRLPSRRGIGVLGVRYLDVP